MKKKEFFLLFFIIIVAFVVRLYRFDNPIADWHSWRQADTSAVSRNFVKYGFDLLHPRYDDLTKTLANIDNPEGYRFVEFPLYNTMQAGLFFFFDTFTLEEWGRLVSILSQLLSILLLYLIVKKYADMKTAFLSSFFFAFIPYNIYFGRTILPDPSMVASVLAGIYFFDKWLSSNVILRPKAEESRSFARYRLVPGFASLRMTLWYVSAILFTASAFLLKPFALFFVLPMLYLAWDRFGVGLFRKWQLWVFVLLSVLPLALWRVWMLQYPEGIPASLWLLNGNDIRFKGAFFQWIFADRIARLILGYWGLPLVFLGIIRKGRGQRFFLSFLLSTLLYLFFVATGNVTHDYYQILIVPTLAIFAALGISVLLTTKAFQRVLAIVLAGISVAFMLGFGWYHVRDYFNINHPEIVEAGKVVDRIAPKDAKVIAVYNGDTAFLYQTNRRGWAMFDRELRDLIRAGASYLVYVNPTSSDFGLSDDFATVAKTARYVIYDLTKPPRIAK